MKFDVNFVDTWYRRLLVLASLSLGVVDYMITPPHAVVHAFFVVSMAGVVGYYTNFLAIKMLFQPKQGKVLGWEGLVPKNKQKIAVSLGNSIQNRLLHPEILMIYIYEKNLVEVGLQKLAKQVDEAIRNDEIRAKITSKIVTVLKEKGPEIIAQLFDLSEDAIKNFAQSPEEVKKIWNMARNRIFDYIKTQENRQKIAEKVRVVILQEIPRLSTALNDGLEDYLSAKKALGSIGIGVKKLVSFNDEAIAGLLEAFIQDPETSDQFMNMMDQIMDGFQEKLNSPETQEVIMGKLDEWLDQLADYARQNILPKGIERLQGYLDDENNWKEIDNYFFRMIDWIKTRLMDFMKSEEGKEYLKVNIGKIVHQINVTRLVETQVMKLDTDDLEKMILDNTGGNLVVIQVLGGVLGMIAGLIQVNVLFAAPVGILTLIVYFAHRRNAKKYGDL
ncbi:MAG: DUF445 family protein [Leptospira sp.]|jgi:uncharacterized membrane protein YheB (UPF0754 family)|nr:DUF445 family protein [Leptospira sp.]NCS92598.1 DUF445 family protein [Leptospira sp.]